MTRASERPASSSIHELRVEAHWTRLKRDIRERWGDLTDDELDQIEGETEQLVGAIQKKYGRSVEEARKEVDEWRREHGH